MHLPPTTCTQVHISSLIYHTDAPPPHHMHTGPYQAVSSTTLVLISSETYHGNSLNQLSELNIHTISYQPVKTLQRISTLLECGLLVEGSGVPRGVSFTCPPERRLSGWQRAQLHGDVRTATNALQFTCLRGEELWLWLALHALCGFSIVCIRNCCYV